MYKPTRTLLSAPKLTYLTAYDFETSGLSKTNDQITQLGAIIVGENLQQICCLDRLVKPRLDVLIDPQSALITGISPSEMATGVTEKEAIEQMVALHARHECSHFVGYNNMQFDSKVLHHCAYRNLAHLNPSQLSGRQLDIYLLVQLMYALRPRSMKFIYKEDKPSLKLEDMCSANGIELLQAHNAVADIQGSVELMKLIKELEPALYDYWLSLSVPANIETLCKGNEWLLMTNTAFGNKTRYTRPVAPVIEKPFGYFALDLTLNFSTDEKHLFQKINKFSSPLISEVTDYQGGRLLEGIGLSESELAMALETLRNHDINALFEEWQGKHPKKSFDSQDDVYLSGYDKFNEDELNDVRALLHCPVSNIEPPLLKSPRVRALGSRICAFQGNEAREILNLGINDLRAIGIFLKNKLPEQNKSNQSRLESLNTLITETKDDKRRQILSDVKFSIECQLQVWSRIIEMLEKLSDPQYDTPPEMEESVINMVKNGIATDNELWINDFYQMQATYPVCL